ncbi:MAG: AMP-binding protein [Acidimicrobiales bacterium]
MNLANIIDPHPDDSVALVWQGRPTTYGELRRRAAGLRGGLSALGVGSGDRVVLLLSNKPAFVETYLAVLGLGAVAVPLNATDPAAVFADEVATVGASVVVVGRVAQAAWTAVDPAAVPSVRHVVSVNGLAGAESLDDLAGHEPVPVADLEPEHLAVLLFTSGTAGAPKAAMLSHRNLLSNLSQGELSPDRFRRDDVVYGILPLNHIFGLNVVLAQTLAKGGSIVLVQRFDPATALDTIRDRKVTIIPGAPPMWTAWAAMPADPTAFASVRLALTGAAKMPEDAMADLRRKFGVALREGYGLTEAAPVVTTSTGIEPRPGSVGKALDGVELRLVGPDGDDVLDGDSGEIWVRGPNVFLGYWNDPAATARVLTPDGWLKTGDVATVDAEGYLYLVDRAKDLIIVSGFNVYPAEVESALGDHPAVAEAAVIGVPHPHTGEAVKAYVVLRPGASANEEQLIDHCHELLARYKCPSKVLVVDELPHGLGGKLLRRALR